jgi:hypothetical protein
MLNRKKRKHSVEPPPPRRRPPKKTYSYQDLIDIGDPLALTQLSEDDPIIWREDDLEERAVHAAIEAEDMRALDAMLSRGFAVEDSTLDTAIDKNSPKAVMALIAHGHTSITRAHASQAAMMQWTRCMIALWESRPT